MKDKLHVLLTTEGTYPFHQGGVSTWCDHLVKGMDSVNYTIYSVLMDPYITQKFELPESAQLIKMPLWGTEEPSEHLAASFSQTFLSKRRTTTQKITKHFIPLYEELIHEIIQPVKTPDRLAKVLLELHLYFQHYEYKVSFKSEEAWEVYKRIVLDDVSSKDSGFARPDVYSLIQSLGWIYRFLNILNTPLPHVDVTHSSAAAFCGIPCVLAKMKNGTPFMLTEHGVYLREQYLSLAKREYSSFLNTFLMRLVHSVTSLNYAFADQVSPVCHYNTRWEKEFGIPQERIKVIYNGVDQDVFIQASAGSSPHPTVVSVARIDPIKDIEMLIKAADLVKRHVPNVRFMIYGSVSVQEYYMQCLRLRKQLDLEETVIFAGHTSDMAAAYHSGDIVALTSISEAFPYSVIEAMMSKKAVISTDVGGVKEALGSAGILVPARSHEKMAEEIIRLLQSPELRMTMAEEAHDRARTYFTINRVFDEYYKSYHSLASQTEMAIEQVEKEKIVLQTHTNTRIIRMNNQRIWMERGYALKVVGYYGEAIHSFRQAIEDYPNSPAVPCILLEIVESYNHLGQYDLAFNELEKFRAYTEILTA